MARCPHCGNKVKFSWSSLFNNRSARKVTLSPEWMFFSCETCKKPLTLSVWDIVFFYLIFGLAISLVYLSFPLLLNFFQIPADKGLMAVIAWMAFLGIFCVGWVYFGIRFVWWEMLIMLRCADAGAQQAKVRLCAAVIVTALAVIVCVEIYGRTVHKISVLEWMRTGEIRRLK